MANFNTAVVDSYQPQGDNPLARRHGGEVQVAYASITADLATSDAITFFDLPVGAHIVGGWLETTALGAGVVVDLGFDDGDTDDVLLDGVSVAGAGRVNLVVPYVVVPAEEPARQGHSSVIGTFAGANPAAGTYTLVVYYCKTS